MAFGEGIAGVCADIEEHHGPIWAWVSFIGIFGGAILTGLLIGWVSSEHIDWTVGREFPNQPPCSEPHVCDTFHGYLVHDIRTFLKLGAAPLKEGK